jgi:iron-sulfur cluster assembly accessory protein
MVSLSSPKRNANTGKRKEMTITVTESARIKVEAMCIENDMVAVRAFVHGTGCSGMEHSLTFSDQKLERDTEVAPNIIIDPVAYQFLDGATIDYDTSGMNPTFVFTDVFKEQGGTGMCGGCGGAGY